MNSAEKGAVLHCLKSMIDEALCEECPLYGTTGTDHCEKDCVRLAINTLEQEPCDDAISRQAVLDEIEFFQINPQHFDFVSLIDNIKDFPSVKPQEPKWIPVNERLPERDVNVLAYARNISFEYQRVMWIDDYSGKWSGCIGHFDEVIAWMPLPKPYEPQERSGKECLD